MEKDIALGILGHQTTKTPLFLPAGERARHMYAIGRTGSGKTTFMRSCALQDIHAGHGLCFIDPHGDVAEALADSIPRHRINDTIYFNAADRDHVIGFNPLEGAHDVDEADLLSSEMVTTLKGLFGNSWGEWLEYLLKHSVFAVTLRGTGAKTIAGVERMLSDDRFRRQVQGELKDPIARRFWEREFTHISKRVELEKTSSTLNKVGKFSLAPVLRNILGQSRSGFSVKRAMDSRQIVIVNLAKGQIGEDNANFLGALMVSKIVSTALRRSEIPEHERVPFYLHIDEFQTVGSEEYTSVVSEARKFALSLLMAHQNFDQIPTSLLNQIIKGAGTLVAFKVSFGDSEQLEKAFHPIKRQRLEDTRDGEFFVRVSNRQPQMVRGFPPTALDLERTGSLRRVVNNSRWRYSRPRAVVEREFKGWYNAPGPGEKGRKRVAHFE